MQHWARTVIEEALSTTGQPSSRLLQDLARIVGLIENLEWHHFRTDGLEDVVDRIVECSDIDELSQLLCTASVELGFEHATVFVLRQGSGTAFSQRICTSYPMSWVRRYQERSYQFMDPVMARALVSDEPFLFSDLADSVPMIKAFWKDAEAHGVGRLGLCCTFELSGSTRIGVSFSSSQPEAAFRDTVRLNGQDALITARLLATAFCSLAHRDHSNDCPLTMKELRFLHQMLVADEPEEALKGILGVGTTEALQSSICAKLGVRSVLQAISVSSANRWFDELPYEVQDVSSAVPKPAEPREFAAEIRCA